MDRVVETEALCDEGDLGHRLTYVFDRGDRVEAHFDNGSDITVDVLVGADGIHSTVRR